MMKRVAILKNIISNYEEEGFSEPWQFDALIKIFQERQLSSLLYWCEEKLSLKEKKLLVHLLKEFGPIDDYLEIPGGRALETGTGSIVQCLIRELTPRWKRRLKGCLSFGLSCLIVGLLTKWLFSSFVVGVYTVVLGSGFLWMLKYIPYIYLQNELLLRQQNMPLKKRRAAKRGLRSSQQSEL